MVPNSAGWRLLVVALLITFFEVFGGLTCASAAQGSTIEIAKWTRYEAQFTSSLEYENPVQEVQVEVGFTSPSGMKQTALAFWDGGKSWKVRFAPNEVGKWTYRTHSTREANGGLNAQIGEFTCVPYRGNNPLYLHGPIRVSEDGWHFVHADGTPFFWLGDTAWLAALKSEGADWETYLNDRRNKGFNVINIFTTQSRHNPGDAEGRLAYTGKEKIGIDVGFFRRLDQRMNAINEHGLVVAPALLHDSIVVPPRRVEAHWYLPELLAEDQLVVLGRYLVARYGAHQVVWVLGSDGNYQGEKAEMWKRIGPEVFKYAPERLASMHQGGLRWCGDEFRREPWYNFIIYQSGHGDSERELRWLTTGPPSLDWSKEPHLPVINNEPNYEGFIPYGSKTDVPFDAHAARRACYWSLLVAPTCGVTYGVHGVWYWGAKPELPMQAEAWGVVPPWDEAMTWPGSTNMKHLKEFFTSLEYWRLLPDPELVADQPGKDTPQRFIAAARSEAGDLAVVYIPEGGKVTLRMDRMKSPVKAEWFDPASGWRKPGEQVENIGIHEFQISHLRDSLLVLRSMAE